MKNKKHISLNEIGKELPFSVPENYFEDFAASIEAKIMGESKPMRKVMSGWMYMAAMVVGIVIMGQVFFSIYQNYTIKGEDNYELYVLSQVNETYLIDYYVDDSEVK
jgi:hypothetical protein